MVRGDGIQSSVSQRFQQRPAVLVCSQRRAPAPVSVFLSQRFLGQQKIMGGGFPSDLHAPFFSVTDHGGAHRRAHMADMNRDAIGFRQRDFPGCSRVFAGRRHAGNIQFPGNRTLVHQSALGQI